MKKLLSIFIFVFFIFNLKVSDLMAAKIPTIRVRVVNAITSAPISGVWVGMHTGGCGYCPACGGGEATRYERTDSNGYAVFDPVYPFLYMQPGPSCTSDSRLGQMIDTDLDGVDDSQRIPLLPSNCLKTFKDGSTTQLCTNDFGCFGSPFDFEVVHPVGLGGYFSNVYDVVVNNAETDFTLNVPNILYHPSGSGTTPTPRSPTPTLVPTDPISCSISLPSSINIPVGGSYTLSPVRINAVGGSVDQVRFIINPQVASLCNAASSSCPPGSFSYVDSTPSFGISMTRYIPGTADLTVEGIMSYEGEICTANVSINTVSVDPWWQVVGGSVTTNGNLVSRIPSTCVMPMCNPYFILSSTNSRAGALSSGISGSFGSGQVSNSGWLAERSFYSSRRYNYEYFEGKLRDIYSVNINKTSLNASDFSGGITPVYENGFEYYFYDGALYSSNLTINDSFDFGARKVVIVVNNASVNINGNLNVNDGQGFLLIVSKNDIVISDSVGGGSGPHIEALLFADDEFRVEPANSQLRIRGAVTGSFVVLGRDLSDNSIAPSEVIEFSPDMYLMFPAKIAEHKLKWGEVLP